MNDVRHNPVSGLYVHVPFCAQKCNYCAFYSEASSGELMNRYVRALTREMAMLGEGFKPRTLFFGGGTPSLLNTRHWGEIFSAMDRCGLLQAGEITVECNPATLSLDKARMFRDNGVNRISMGVQSLDENLLERLGRVHSREMVFKSFDVLRSAGFHNINLDLMFAIPTQTMAQWRQTLAEVIAMGSEHLSSYEVIYEDDTPLFHQLQAGEFSVDEDLACDMHEELIQTAEKAGFHQYEIANFARHEAAREPGSEAGKAPASSSPLLPSLACRHNINYWRGGHYHALGPGACGYVQGVRTKNKPNTTFYCQQIEDGVRAIESEETLSPLKRAGETAAFGLRMNTGWDFEQFQDITRFDLKEDWASDMSRVVERGWGVMDDRGFRLNRRGLRFADAVASDFLR